MTYHPFMIQLLRCSVSVPVWCVLMLNCGCERTADQPQAESPPAVLAPSPWRESGDSWQIALKRDLDQPELADAIAQAQATMDEAREQWLVTSSADRTNWAVQWAAPAVTETGAETTEHVWVQPLHWSPFRVEGVLLSEPLTELVAGKSRGELVGFSSEEVTDWVHFVTGDREGERHGGFTIDALQKRFGSP